MAEFVVHGAIVRCNYGSKTTTLVGTSDSRIGGQIHILA